MNGDMLSGDGTATPAASKTSVTDDQEVDWPAPAASKSLPEIAKKAYDLEAIKKAVDDAASVSGALWFSYLFVMFYLAVAAGAVTHADLFLENPVKLPFLGVELPLLAFFFIAPILFLIVHAYVLVHLVMLTDKAKRFHEELHKQFTRETGLSEENAKNIRDEIRRQLPSNVFVQFLAGAPETREGSFGQALRAIGWTTLVVGPILLLLLMQVQFLPYHNRVVTWTQRLALLGDLALIWWLWGRILSGRDSEVGSTLTWSSRAKFLAWAALIFSWLIAVFPGEWQSDLPSQRLTRLIFQSEIDSVGHRWLPFSNTLVLVGFDIYENLKIDDPEKLKRNSTFHAQGRDLIGANFRRANLTKVDFAGAHLEDAVLDSANFHEARLGCNAPLAESGPGCVHFQGASLTGAHLQGMTLDGAELQSVLLDEAELQGASLKSAALQGASLRAAKLQGALLDNARLQGASLNQAELQGASLVAAHLQGVSLESAHLQGASLDGAQLQGASVAGATLLAASLNGAQLQGTSFSEAQLQGGSILGAVLTAVDLSKTQLWRTELTSIPSDVKFAETNDTWKPIWFDTKSTRSDGAISTSAWDNEAYTQLSRVAESLPAEARQRFMAHIQTLDCGRKDNTLASCVPSNDQPAKVVEFEKALKDAGIDGQRYAKSLSAALRAFVCSQDADAIYALRGEGFHNRLAAAGADGSKLIDVIIDKESGDCPVAAAATEADRAALLGIKSRTSQ